MDKVRILKDLLEWYRTSKHPLYKEYYKYHIKEDHSQCRTIARNMLRERINVDPKYRNSLPTELLIELGVSLKLLPDLKLTEKERTFIKKDFLEWFKANNSPLYKEYYKYHLKEDHDQCSIIAKNMLRERINVEPKYTYGLPSKLLIELGIPLKLPADIKLTNMEKTFVQKVNGELLYSLEM